MLARVPGTGVRRVAFVQYIYSAGAAALARRGAVCANAHAYDVWHFGAPWRSRLASTKEKNQWNKYRNHLMK